MWRRIRFVAMVLLMLTGTMGCGKKGPPLPPLVFTPPAPIELAYQLEADQVTLQWKLAPEFEKKAGGSDMAVEIYKATRELTEDVCQGCPLTFEKTAEVPLTTLRHGDSIERGYRYFYRLRIVQDNAVSSAYSETLSFDFE